MIEEQNQLRSDIYLLLAALCRQAPDASILEFLANLEAEAGNSDMAIAWGELSTMARQNLNNVESLEQEYQDLFIGIGKGQVVPFASWHLTGSLMEKPLAEIRQDLNTLGFERSDSVKEPEDHVSAICEVIAMLIAQGDELKAKSFFNKHLSPWYQRFYEQLNNASSAQFYKPVSTLMKRFFDVEQVKYAENPYSTQTKLKIDVKNLTSGISK
ncbi:molecular chaperone TorD family protein [Vibrio sp. ZSDZ34]|uniref:Molecular chaperone TorD family protein n=1 Tax=Vibrio gelatinilyticus TaxID=2893468 RepID=A0A9X1WHC9_9VIBR|nr:molecular chaperone TorD family protein [Vibrio gelatinilyticus]